MACADDEVDAFRKRRLKWLTGLINRKTFRTFIKERSAEHFSNTLSVLRFLFYFFLLNSYSALQLVSLEKCVYSLTISFRGILRTSGEWKIVISQKKNVIKRRAKLPEVTFFFRPKSVGFFFPKKAFFIFFFK